MAYLGTLEGWKQMAEVFEKHGYKIDHGLDNDPYMTTIEDEETFVEHDELPEECKKALTDFAKRHNLEY